MSKVNTGSIPVFSARGESLAAAWEASMIALYREGCEVRTEYDEKDKNGNWVYPPSKDATVMVVVSDPSSEPFIHRAFPGGMEDLEEYRQEVVDGIKDHWVRRLDDPEDKRWEYTYHGRLTKYPSLRFHESVDQLDKMIKKLAKVPYSRRCNAITWQPWCDPDCIDPPCLQSIWLRALEDEDGVLRLNMNVRFRSRDAYDAGFMNMFALIGLQERLAIRLSREADREVKLGRYCDISDSYHIYGRRLQHFKENFLSLVGSRTFEERTWTREFAELIFKEARPMIREKVARQDVKGEQGKDEE